MDTASQAAVRWKQWFETFSETTLEDVKNNMKQLTAFVSLAVYFQGMVEHDNHHFEQIKKVI